MGWGISHKYKFIFIHVPKTGGTTIQSQYPGSVLGDICQTTGVSGGTHKTASEVREMFPKEWEQYTTFAFVRDPITRFKSGFFFTNLMRDRSRDHTLQNIIRDARREIALLPMCHWLDLDIDVVGRLLGDRGMSEGLEFYRCTLCHTVVSVWDVKDGGCSKCHGTRIVPTGLSLWEKLVQIFKHPRLWTWHKQSL